MKPRTPGLWLIPAIIGMLMPSLAIAGMTPEEVKSFKSAKEWAEEGGGRGPIQFRELLR